MPLKVWIFIIVIAIHPPLMPSSSCTRTRQHDGTTTRLRVSLGVHGEDTTTHCLHNATTLTACKEEWITASHLWRSSSMAWCLSHAALWARSRLLSSRPSCRHHGCWTQLAEVSTPYHTTRLSCRSSPLHSRTVWPHSIWKIICHMFFQLDILWFLRCYFHLEILLLS
jgi:hypothetical protein